MVRKYKVQSPAQPLRATPDLAPGEVHGDSASVFPTLYEQALTMSFSEQVKLIQDALGFNRSQIAGVLQISRPTLYAWIDGAAPNSHKNSRLLSLLRLISRAGITSRNPLHARFVRHPLSDHGLSLLELVQRSPFPEEAFLQSLIKAKELTTLLAARAPKPEAAPVPLDPEPLPPVVNKAPPAFSHVLL